MNAYTLLGARIPAAPAAVPAPPAAATPAPRQWKFKALSTTQKATIGRLASTAYKAEADRGNVTIPATGKTDHAREWRHGEYFKVTGRNELEACNQSHFRELRSHFEGLIGTPASSARSFRDSMRTGPANSKAAINDTHEARELWRHHLTESLTKYSFHESYAAAICRNKYKCALGQATAEQLRNLNFAVIGNGRKKGSTGVPAPSKKLTIIKPDDSQPF